MNGKINNFFLVIDDFLNEETVEELYRSLLQKDFESFFVFKKDLNNSHEVVSQRTSINDIIRKTWIDNLPFLSEGVVGFEVWSNFMQGNSTLGLNIDSDEQYHATTGNYRTPIYTSVLYLGPENHLTGGELALGLNEHFNVSNASATTRWKDFEQVRKDDNNWVKISYKRNRLVVFDPFYPHQVLPIEEGTEKSPRVGLTMAAWDREIKIMEEKKY